MWLNFEYLRGLSNIKNDTTRLEKNDEGQNTELANIRKTIENINTTNVQLEKNQLKLLEKLLKNQEIIQSNEARFSARLENLLESIHGQTKSINTGTELKQLTFPKKTCLDVPSSTSGIFRLQPGDSSFKALCDQDYEGGGWTVIQNRYDGSVDFFRNWTDYEKGFGDLQTEFWLGLEKIHQLTTLKAHELHVVLETFDGEKAVAKYSHFVVDGPKDKYKLSSLGTYSGNAGDSLKYHLNMKFTTKDEDNDVGEKGNCAITYQGAWWYKKCIDSNLNGLYRKGSKTGEDMVWYHFKNDKACLKRSRMMVRAIK
ncbi:ficolin-2-like [Uranotaenia lowii]|uniref:ficolin-2-like n=1 Tax=Uranotaenia lowii TaxID=190385 RepID=UPI00247931E3|nr:ficolin-2-like [Uranotaenia lowii]